MFVKNFPTWYNDITNIIVHQPWLYLHLARHPMVVNFPGLVISAAVDKSVQDHLGIQMENRNLFFCNISIIMEQKFQERNM